MGSSAPNPPPAPDPNAIIQAQEQANRINRITPFGSQTYGPNGLTTSLSPESQTAFNNVAGMAGHQQQLLSPPQGFGDLQSALMSRVGNRYSQPQKPQGAGMPQFPSQINGQQVSPMWGDAMQRIWSPRQ